MGPTLPHISPHNNPLSPDSDRDAAHLLHAQRAGAVRCPARVVARAAVPRNAPNACSRPRYELQFPSMPALVHRDAPRPAPAPSPPPHLRALAPPRSRRAPSARAVALYAVGLVAGFLLAAAASVP